jgi:hypothetical protein
MKSSAKNIAVGGVLLALCEVLLYMGSVVPGVDLTLMALAGGMVYLSYRFIGVGGSAVFCAASIILSLLIVPAKLTILPYIFVLGPYAFLKPLIERPFVAMRAKRTSPALYKEVDPDQEYDPDRVNDRTGTNDPGNRIHKNHQKNTKRKRFDRFRFLEYLSKVIVFAVLTGAGVLLFQAAFLGTEDVSPYMVPFIVLGGLVMFVCYDVIIGFVADFAVRRLNLK